MRTNNCNIGIDVMNHLVSPPTTTSEASMPFLSLKEDNIMTKIANLTHDELVHVMSAMLCEDTMSEALGLMEDMLDTAELLGEKNEDPSYMQKGIDILCHMTKCGCESATRHYVGNELQKRYLKGYRLRKAV